MKIALFAVVLALFLATGVITLLGLTQRVKIEQIYLNRLFSALILELVAAVVFLFGSADFFSEDTMTTEIKERVALLDSYYPGVDVSELEHQFKHIHQVNVDLAERSLQLKQAEKSLNLANLEAVRLNELLLEKRNQSQLLLAELDVRRADTLRLNRLERLFLVRMAELSGLLTEWGTSVNFLWQSDEKRDIALLLQEAFKEIGFMNSLEIPNDDPLLAHDILVRYQTEKGFKETGFLTQQTVVLIIQDYLSRANSRIH